MAPHGFRVFKVEPRERHGRKDAPWRSEAGAHLLERFAALAGGFVANEWILDATLTYAQAEALGILEAKKSIGAGDKVLRLIDCGQVGRRLSMRVKYGSAGSFPTLMGVDGDVDITDRAPAREYRVELLAPRDVGPGLMAVETISRVAPAVPLVQLLSIADMLDPARPGGDPWFKLFATQVTDPDYLAELIKRTKNAELHLRSVDVGGEGDRTRTRYRLQAKLDDVGRSGILGWLKRADRNVAGMLEVVDVRDSGDFDFNEGYVDLDDGDSRTRVGLHDAREVFTYPINSDIEPDRDTWERAVRDRFRTLRPDLDWA